MKYLLILSILLGINTGFVRSQEDTPTEVFLQAINRPIHIYTDSTGHEEAYTIMQDSIFGDYFRIAIVAGSARRFQVQVEKCMDYSPQISGWIPKNECGVYLLHLPGLKPAGYRLYQHPDSLSVCQTLEGEIDGPVDILDRKGKWLELSFPFGNQRYRGWTDWYCPNIFGSCN